jgi:hypothetical protein
MGRVANPTVERLLKASVAAMNARKPGFGTSAEVMAKVQDRVKERFRACSRRRSRAASRSSSGHSCPKPVSDSSIDEEEFFVRKAGRQELKEKNQRLLLEVMPFLPEFMPS